MAGRFGVPWDRLAHFLSEIDRKSRQAMHRLKKLATAAPKKSGLARFSRDNSRSGALADLPQGGGQGTDETPGGVGRKVRDKPGPRPAHLFDRELDPEVVAKLAIVESSDGPGNLGALGVVGRVVVAAVVCKLLHRVAPGAGRGALLPVMFHDFFGPNRDLVRVQAGGSPGATLTEKVPALVQGDLDVVKPLQLSLRKLFALVRALEPVLLLSQLPDLVHDVDVVHVTPSSRS